MSEENTPREPGPVRTARADGITTVTLDAPHRRNALSARLMRALYTALEEAREDPDTRAVLLTHTGNTFCAGADLSEAGAQQGPTEAPLALARLLRTVVEFPKPVVARVTGHVRAGGTGLLAACDISVAGPGATFAFTEARIGVAPAVISMPVLPRVDPRAAARYYLTGERFGPREAARIGLVTLAAEDPPGTGDVAPRDADGGGPRGREAVDAALAPVLDGLRRGSPQGLRESKRLAAREVLAAFDRDTGTLADLSARLFASAEAREGMTAFLERRDPEWAVRQASAR
ncbi:enoyl-CoA hydratase family protein [Streptomyces cacaoi]|uniref:enoyl-CoA hydratase family protein n=1 Tax=Streptomyces cacaoi TaxID=1898 RepID=UPI0011F19832|nr:enoyl-CoA hydratase family protein [Streptomyces cacaoi]